MKTLNNMVMKLTKLALYALTIIPIEVFGQWVETNPGIGLSSVEKIDCIDGNNCFIGASGSGSIMKTTDAGENWINTDLSIGGALNYLKMLSTDTCYVIKDLNLCRTYNGGGDWDVIALTNVGNKFYFLNSRVGWGVGLNELMKTTDKGVNWSGGIDFPNGVDGISVIYFMDEMNGFIGTGNNTNRSLYKTTNGGQNWTLVFDKVSTNHAITKIQMLTPLVGYACGMKGMILRTIDGGNSWTELSNPVQDQNIDLKMDFVNTNSGYFAGNMGNIFKTINGGDSFIAENHGVSACLDVAVADLDKVFVGIVGTDILLVNDNAGLVAKINDNELVIGSIYPNPTSNFLNINLQKENCKLIILDATGKVVLTKELSLINEVEISSLSSGLYHYIITQQNGAISTGKITKN